MPRKHRRTTIESMATKLLISKLDDAGRELTKRAAESKETGNVTFNQLESYGWCVFHNGKRVKTGYYYEGALGSTMGYDEESDTDYAMGAMYNGRVIDGNAELNGAFRQLDNQLSGYNGIALVILNAVPYTRGLEEGRYARPHPHKWKVISQIFGDLDSIARQLKHGAAMSTYKGEEGFSPRLKGL